MRNRSGSRLRIAMLGTRGVPARYGGFETAVEEIGSRLAEQGHEVVVYGRSKSAPPLYRGIKSVFRPSIRTSALETISHTGLSAIHAVSRRKKPGVVFLFNSANSIFIPIFWLRKIPVVLHVDGIEWLRAKWSGMGKIYYRFAEAFGSALAAEVISDAEAIHSYHHNRFGSDSTVIRYGAPIITPPVGPVMEMGLTPRAYMLIVARIEPENHVDVALEGALLANGDRPIVVVGSVPYESPYARRVAEIARSSDRVVMAGAVWDQTLLDSLYAHCAVYIHGHSVGGTNPSLLRAMGAAAPIAAWDVEFNREVLGRSGIWWRSAAQLADAIDREVYVKDAPLASECSRARGIENQKRATSLYQWNEVAADYLRLAQKAVDVFSPRRRRPSVLSALRSARRDFAEALLTGKSPNGERHRRGTR